MQNLIERAAQDLVKAKYAIALTGAGISTESGIRDFRGPDGIWTKDPDAERRAYEAYAKFKKDPKGFWEETLSGPSLLGDLSKVRPNAGHFALATLEKMGILKGIITQNIDNLHEQAGSRKVLDYHGNISRLRCIRCATRYPVNEYDLEMLHATGKLPPRCKKCNGILKPDVVYFQEPIPTDVAEESQEEAIRCDLVLLCGTSAVVYPFASLPRIARAKSTGLGRWLNMGGYYAAAPANKAVIIEINAESTPLTEEGISDYLIQGKIGQILPAIVQAIEKTRKP